MLDCTGLHRSDSAVPRVPYHRNHFPLALALALALNLALPFLSSSLIQPLPSSRPSSCLLLISPHRCCLFFPPILTSSLCRRLLLIALHSPRPTFILFITELHRAWFAISSFPSRTSFRPHSCKLQSTPPCSNAWYHLLQSPASSRRHFFISSALFEYL